jgi:hypothetical protein
VVPTLGRILRT